MKLAFDIETYKNYTLFAFMDIKTENIFAFEMHEHKKFKQQKALTELLKKHTIITFNGLHFDEPITSVALNKDQKPSEIFRDAQDIIVNKMNIFQYYRTNKTRPIIEKHIDLIDVAMGVASLKLYGARLGAKKLQDLPYPPETELTKKQKQEVLDYCINDLKLTKLLYENLQSDLQLRKDMSKKYGINFMSDNGAKIAEKILVKETGYEGKAPSRPERVFYTPPKYIKFKTKVMQDFFAYVKEHVFLVNENGNVELPTKMKNEKLQFTPNGIEYKLGVGGVHGSVESTSIHADKGYSIIDIDYKSLYPSLIIENNFVPKHIGKKFLKVYKDMYHQRNNVLKPMLKRLEYASKEYIVIYSQQNTFKLILNSSFGRLGLRYSKLYDPSALLHVTLTGQLTLMMIIEKLHLAGFETFYANTDGITLKVKTKDVPKIKEITTKFDKKTGLEMEYNEFRSCHIRDVNNFVNITTDGKVKPKGSYAKQSLNKNSQTPIVYEAIREFLLNGTSMKKTINNCKDVNMFCSSVTVKGGATYSNSIPEMYPPDWQEKLDSKRGLTKKIIGEREKLEADWVKNNGVYLGKVVRWYYSTDGYSIHRKLNGNKVPKTDGCIPMMDLTKKLPKDLDYQWYYDEADSILIDLGVTNDYVQSIRS